MRAVTDERPYTVDAPGLFREFAMLPTTEEAYLGFAHKYGFLGVRSLNADENELAESVEEFGWWEEHHRVWKVLTAWDLLNDEAGEDTELLERVFEPHPPTITPDAEAQDFEAWRAAFMSARRTGGAPPAWPHQVVVRQQVWAAGPKHRRIFTVRLVRRSMRDKRKSWFDLIATEINAARARHQMMSRLQIRSDDPGDGFQLVDSHEPTTLIQLIWTQLTAATTQRKDLRPCGNSECRHWITRSPTKRGRKARFCSDACRAAVDQRNVALARRLASQGKSLAATTKATRLTRDRVKRIIEAEKRKGKE